MAVSVRSLSDNEYTHISQLEEGKAYEQVFYIAHIEHNAGMVTSNGVVFANILLSDVSGEINLLVWNYIPDILKPGDFVSIKTECKSFKGNPQLNCQGYNITKLDATPENFYDYFNGVTSSQLDSYAQELQETLEYLEDDDYRNFACIAIHHYDLIKLLRQSPYDLKGPLAYRGGLLVHIVHTVRLAHAACNQAKVLETNMSESLVIMASVFRKIGYCTTTEFVDGNLVARDTYGLNGIENSTLAVLTQIFYSNRDSIPKHKYDALVNCCGTKDPKVLEGKIANSCSSLASTIDTGIFETAKARDEKWFRGYYLGHLCD